MLRYLPIFFVAFVVYLSLSTYINYVDIIIGIIVAIIISIITTPTMVKNPKKFTNLKRLYGLISYSVYYFVYLEIKSHYIFIKSILFDKPKFKPSIVKVRYMGTNDFAITASANSITNTPGTVVIDVDENKKNFYVHWLYAESTNEEFCYRNILEPIESKITKIFE